MSTKKSNKLIRSLDTTKSIKPTMPEKLVVNPSRYISNYNKSIQNRYSDNRSVSRNYKNNTKTNVNILLIIIIVFAIAGVILVILHFEKDIFNTIPDPPTQATLSTTSITSHQEEPKREQKEEVFFVTSDKDENKFDKIKAEAVCKALGTDGKTVRLATYTDLLDYTNRKGPVANWCEYGWLIDNREGKTGKDILGFYPNKNDICNTNTTPKSAVNVKDGDTQGKIDVIAGPQADELGGVETQLKLGVNCYGMKPDMSPEFKEALLKKRETAAAQKKKEEENKSKQLTLYRQSNIAQFNKDEDLWSANIPNEEYLKDPICDNSRESC